MNARLRRRGGETELDRTEGRRNKIGGGGEKDGVAVGMRSPAQFLSDHRHSEENVLSIFKRNCLMTVVRAEAMSVM